MAAAETSEMTTAEMATAKSSKMAAAEMAPAKSSTPKGKSFARPPGHHARRKRSFKAEA